MVGTVVEDNSEIDYRISRQVTASSGVLDSLFYRRNVVLGDCPAENVVHEFKLCAARQWFHLDLAVAELSVTAGLLLVTALHVGAPTNGLAIRHLRRFQIHFGVIALLHLRNGHFDVLLPCAGDQELLSLRIAEEAQHGVFFHQLVDTGTQFVFVGTGLGLNGKCDRRFRQPDFGILDGRRLIAQSVSGQSVFQFRDRANITGVQLGDRHSSFSLHDGNVRQLLLRIASEILQRNVVLQHAGKNLEIRNAPGKWIRNSFEDVQGHWL